ncbi:G-protein-coupled receptor family protein [Tieghemostelium lacteum]|uniref:G-protein-coupled receptor family protein n=1 Tax=Tieghemostelium lacteum TaxID=361077 RepID=A0A152A2K3_TIELA|nr:G-protein-coupled receptor family protein [Tieghemostelium lacteum]|eukprot:KYR00301.1 G-protein-coupled receptor family protein [Tieghemostelium lacteum]
MTTSDRNLYVHIFDWISTGLSFVGCLFIIIHYFWIPQLRKSLSKYVIYPTFCLLASIIVTIPSYFEIPFIYISHSSALCFIQQSVIQFSIFANFLWSIIISVNLLYLCFRPYKNLKKYEIIYHIFCWGLSILVTIITRIPLLGYEIFSECGPGGIPSTFKFYTDTIVIFLFIIFNILVLLILIKHMIKGNLVDSEKKTTLLFNNEKRITAKKIVWRLLLYPIILCICYIPTIIYTIVQYRQLKDPNLHILSSRNLSLLSSVARGIFHLQGFFNALVYMKSSKLRYQYKKFKLFRFIFWRNEINPNDSSIHEDSNSQNNDYDNDTPNNNNNNNNSTPPNSILNNNSSTPNYKMIKSASYNNFQKNSYQLSSSLTPFPSGI